jgi:transposase
MTEDKRKAIKLGIQQTREKRKFQRCLAFELKINYSNLNKKEKETLKMFFVEAKWLYNHILNQKNVFNFNTKNRIIQVKDKDGNFIEKELKYLPAKNRQDVGNVLKNNIKALSFKKKNGKFKQVGKLKFKSEYNSIELSQYGTTHKIVSKNRMKINGIKRPLLIHGLEQIKPEYEIANAKLIKKASGYYIKLTCFEFINFKYSKNIECKGEIGLDFGIKNNITTSDNMVFNLSIEEDDTLKRLQKRLSKSQKGSKNRYKLILKIRKKYEKLNNIKKDKSNKFINYLLINYSTVYMQDENLKAWQSGLFGEQVQHSCLGTIKSKLKQSKSVIVVDRFEPTTKMCYNCGKLNNLSLSERIYVCECGIKPEDRDLHSAKVIKFIGQTNKKYVPVEHR